MLNIWIIVFYISSIFLILYSFFGKIGFLLGSVVALVLFKWGRVLGPHTEYAPSYEDWTDPFHLHRLKDGLFPYLCLQSSWPTADIRWSGKMKLECDGVIKYMDDLGLEQGAS